MPEKNRFPAVLQPIHVVHGTQDPCVSETTAFALGRNNGGENVIAFSAKDYGADASVNLSPTLRAGGHTDSHANGGVGPAIAYAIQERAICENPAAGPDGVGVRSDDCAYTLEARQVPQAVAIIPFDTTQITSPSNYSNPQAGDPCHPLAAGAHPPSALRQCVTEPVTHCLKADGFDASEDGTGRGQPIVPATMYSIMPMNSGRDYKARSVDVAQPLMAGGPVGGNHRPDFLLEHVHMAVRRLMPVECERLQGFPDNWTLVPNAKGKPAADGPRYKQCGNSMATKVMHWIGSRIAAALGSNGGPPLDDDFDSLLGDDFDGLLA